ncbi:MAG: PAS domain S-box protein, partial [Dehalococcoidia bacterium]
MKAIHEARKQPLGELLRMRQRLAQLVKENEQLKQEITERKAAEEELRTAEARLFNMIRSNADGILIVDRYGIVRFANPAVEALLGRRAEELIGKPFGSPTVAGETTEVDIVHGDGETVTAEMRVAETEWEGESAYLASLRDITERERMEKELRESEEKLNRYLENSPDAICVTDLEGTILYVNGAAERMIGYSREEFVGNNFLKLGLLAPRHLPNQWLEAGGAERLFRRDEFELIRKDGSHIFAEVSTLPVCTEGECGKTEIVGIIRDITERKRAEEAARLA